MSMYLHLLSHKVLHTQKQNLEKIQAQLTEHHHAHKDEKEAQKRAMDAQAHLLRMHAAFKLHTFHRQLSGQMRQAAQKQDRVRLQGLVEKIGRVESGQAQLNKAMTGKAAAHQDVEKRLLSLKSDVDAALKELEKIKKK